MILLYSINTNKTDNDNEDNSFFNKIIGTTIYMSPERLNGKRYSFLSDVWCIGSCIAQSIYQNFSLFINYDDTTTHIVQTTIVNNNNINS